MTTQFVSLLLSAIAKKESDEKSETNSVYVIVIRQSSLMDSYVSALSEELLIVP
jgi:hypothetical protein